MGRLRGINTVVSDQTFSWVRGYAGSMDELHPARRQFLVHLYAKAHNELVTKGDISQLNPHRAKRYPEINAVRLRRRSPREETKKSAAAAREKKITLSDT